MIGSTLIIINVFCDNFIPSSYEIIVSISQTT